MSVWYCMYCVGAIENGDVLTVTFNCESWVLLMYLFLEFCSQLMFSSSLIADKNGVDEISSGYVSLKYSA